ncbi:MAG: hypothetical protein RRY21_00445 [Oscillospiraceae bacterium]
MNQANTKRWRRLDNAAKIFPSSTSKSDTKVFRFACELTEPIRPDALGQALDRTLEDFSSFRFVLKRGLFWYYLEESAQPHSVRAEDTPPCGARYHDSRSPLFEVTWFDCRINVEVYHVLTDGAGALQFLRALVYHYLLLVHPVELSGCAAPDFDASLTQRMDDGFAKYYSGAKRPKLPVRQDAPAPHRLHGPKSPEWRLQVIEGQMPVDQVLACARGHHATATALMTAVLMCAVYEDMSARERKRPVTVSIPVNLHQYFPSRTVRNFFSVVNIGYLFPEGPPVLEEVIASVKRSLEVELTPEYLQARLDTLAELEEWMVARVLPLAVKNLLLRHFYRRSETTYTTSFSNVGRVSMPCELIPYIRMFDVFSSTGDLQACVCSFHNVLCISFTAQLLSTDIQRHFFRMLSEMGIDVTIAANRYLGMEGER